MKKERMTATRLVCTLLIAATMVTPALAATGTVNADTCCHQADSRDKQGTAENNAQRFAKLEKGFFIHIIASILYLVYYIIKKRESKSAIRQKLSNRTKIRKINPWNYIIFLTILLAFGKKIQYYRISYVCLEVCSVRK